MFNIFSKTPQVSADDVKKALDEKEKFILLDVRTPQEYEKGKIQGSFNLPVDEIESKVEKIIPEKDQTIYVYCLSGSRSSHAVAKMSTLGYPKVFSMASGLLAWRAKKFPLE